MSANNIKMSNGECTTKATGIVIYLDAKNFAALCYVSHIPPTELPITFILDRTIPVLP